MKIYACIDLKSFYASVECVIRKLDPLTTNLVVADINKTSKTICLAVSPSLKKYGLSGRARLYEVINVANKNNIKFIIAKPRMKKYMEYSNNIYKIYLKFVSKEDIFVYSIDEVFIDLTPYLRYYNKSFKEIVSMIIKEIYDLTGITATGGIGTNLFLAKVAMDVLAKKCLPDKNNVRISCLDTYNFRLKLWNYKPLEDIWRIGYKTMIKLNKLGIYTLGDIALFSLKDSNLLYKLFGIQAEFLIDHAWGYESCTIKDIKNYKINNKSISIGQMLPKPYRYENTLLIIKEMIELFSLELVNKNIMINKLNLTIGYDVLNLKYGNTYDGKIVKDRYGRFKPKSSKGSIRLEFNTCSTKILTNKIIILFNQIVDKDLYIRKIHISANVVNEDNQLTLDLNDNYDKLKQETINEIKLQKIINKIKIKYGKNSILKLMNLENDAMTIKRNKTIGGHHE